MRRFRLTGAITVWLLFLLPAFEMCSLHPVAGATEFRGRVVDESTGEPIPARVYLQSESGEWLFVSSAAADGSALPYREQWVPMPQSVEKHTTLSAHPFQIELPRGDYALEIERGKEYLPLRRRIVIGEQPVEETFRLTRWINLAKRGWYSGETHVHRRVTELSNVMLAEDLNVAFPVTFWTIQSDKAPGLEPSPLRSQGPSPFGPREGRGPAPIFVDRTHVILPRNTEYEIFSVDGKRHTLGAIFLLNHRSVFTGTAPPIAAIAEQARSEGALLDLDKHSWPWSMMLVPVAKVDLYELSNNSVWRARFGFNQLPAPLPEWMHVENDGPNTLFATVENKLAGETISFDTTQPRTIDVEIESVSEKYVSQIDILINGEVVDTQIPDRARTPQGTWRINTRRTVKINDSCWLAVRSVEPQPDGRKRFAHTAPWFVSLAGRSIAPRREQVEYFISLMETELTRNHKVLSAAALVEFEQALKAYRDLLPQAK